MTSFFSSCLVDRLRSDQLVDKEVLAKQAGIQRIGYFMLLLLVLFVGMAFALNSYLVAASSWALVPAFADYSKKRKFIRLHATSKTSPGLINMSYGCDSAYG